MAYAFSPVWKWFLGLCRCLFTIYGFFAFLKDVLTGANAISYTFSSNLGSSYIGQFAYYLASPFNVLLLFFSKGNLYSFYDLITALKMGLAASTFSYHAVKRFPSLKTIFVLLLSVGYGLMGYNLQQAGNTMWMDGVYMLPLILLGVYQAIAERKVLLLSTSVGASILFNWYTGGINCFLPAFGSWWKGGCGSLVSIGKPGAPLPTVFAKYVYWRIAKSGALSPGNFAAAEWSRKRL